MAGSTICAASMIYLGYHWTTDAVAGFALGSLIRIGIAPLLATALNPLLGPEDPGPRPAGL
jgi:membrane-associated phospholipid phosphatase